MIVTSINRLSGAVLVACFVSACGGGNPGTASKPSATARSASKNEINPMPRDKVQDGGTFTWAIDAMPPNFNYNEIDGTTQDGVWIIDALVPSVYVSDASGKVTWNPDYLASEPKVTTDPKQVVVFEINPKAIWYDGSPITWQDFYWQWRANNGTNKEYQISGAQGFEDIESVEKGKDDREVIVTFKRKFTDWQSVFVRFYPSSTNRDPKVFNEGWKDKPLTSAGPFKLDSIDRTAQTVTLVRNEKWWGDRAKLDKIVYRAIDPDPQIDALANGEVDAIDVGPDADKYNRAKAIEGDEIRVAGGPNFRHLTFNGTSDNLQDVRVRQAIAMGINRTAIAKALLGPLDVPAEPLNNHIYMANQEGYQDNSGDIGKYNPERAKELLDQAGWKLDGKIRKKDGRPLEIKGIIPVGVAVARQETELIQNMLAQIGVNMTITAVPGKDFFPKYVTTGQFDLTVFAFLGTPYPISSSTSLYVKPTKTPSGDLDIKQNYARIGTDEIDKLLKQATEELDHQKAIALANQLDAAIWQEVHSLTLYQRPEIVVSKKNLANFGAFGFQQPWTYQDIGWVKQ